MGSEAQLHKVLALYKEVQQKISADLLNPDFEKRLVSCLKASVKNIESFSKVALTSRVADKEYFAFKSKKKISRAINNKIFMDSKKTFEIWQALSQGFKSQKYDVLDPLEVTNAIYTIAISFCACIDLIKERDQKTPGTFFEYLIGYLFAKMLRVNPERKIDVLNLDMDSSLPTDYIFNLGKNKPKFHLPIKTSTRERVIQVWAHQRVLDGVYGNGRFLGTPVILTETKTDKTKGEVVEICLPDQWCIYQMHISQLKRIYYLDLPIVYSKLNERFPPIHVRPFGEFFVNFKDLFG